MENKIAKYHMDYAVRNDDIISIKEKKQTKCRGTGAYKAWLPEAILRCCWGLRPCRRTKRRHDSTLSV